MLLTVKPTKMSLYIANGKYSAQQVQNLTGADIVLNCTLYTFATMKPCMDFKADGIVYSDEEPLYEGYGWNSNSRVMTRTTDMVRYDNFISSCNIIKQGKVCSVDGIAWVAGSRARTAIGWKKDGTMVIYANASGQTIAQVTDDMLKAGCVDAINLDGGGSTQIATKKYGNIYSSRKVQNYLCVWEEVTTTPAVTSPSTSVPASYWAQTPTSVNKFPLTVRGTVTLNVRASATSNSKLVRTIPKGQEFQVTGYANLVNKTWMRTSNGFVYRAYTECKNPYREPTSTTIKKGSAGEHVRWIQWWLGQRKYKGLDYKVLGCDGVFGPNTDYALRTFQKDKGLPVTGICDAQTITKLKEE